MNLDIITRRLTSQGLAAPRFETAAEAVGWLGAVQSQDYAGAKWALAQRMIGASEAELDRAFDAGEILRTHVMRPTWHFVRPEDIRWMLALTGTRVSRAISTYDRRLGLDAAIYARTNAIIGDALRGGRFLTRAELIALLQQSGIATDDNMRATHLMFHAELDGVVISGPRRGKQFTYALLDERAPQVPALSREESLAELAYRYFTSHGPATLKDYTWWSALTAADAKAGIAANGSKLVEEVIGGVSYWSAPSSGGLSGGDPVKSSTRVHLLPNYDEYVVAYVDRGDIIEDDTLHRLDPRGNLLFSHTILVDGRVVGAWKRTFKKGAVVVELSYLVPPTGEQAAAVDAALARYGEFLGMRVEVANG